MSVASHRVPLTAVIGGTVAAIGVVVAAVMYFEEQFGQLDGHLARLDTEMATQSQRLDDIAIYAGSARDDREELDDGLKDIRADVAALRQHVAERLGYHAGEHGRIEGAADTLERLLREREAYDVQ